MTANSACNQILKIVKESNLNFLINETPYSAHVTIRKKFVKNSAEVTHENVVVHHDSARENTAKDELNHKFEALIVENNNFKETISQLESENKNMNIRLEMSKGQLSNKNDVLENKVNENKVVSEKNAQLVGELKQVKQRLTDKVNGDKERDDDLIMLEMTLKNRELDIASLNSELDSMKFCL